MLNGNCTSAEALSLYQECTLADSSFRHDWICFIKNTDICKSCFMHTHALLSTITRLKTRLGISLKLPEQLATKKATSWLLWAFSDTVFVQFSPLFGPPISVAPLNTTAFTMFCCRTPWTKADRSVENLCFTNFQQPSCPPLKPLKSIPLQIKTCCTDINKNQWWISARNCTISACLGTS